MPRRIYIFRRATPSFWGLGSFFPISLQNAFYPLLTQSRTFLSKCPQPPRAPPCLTVCAQSLRPKRRRHHFIPFGGSALPPPAQDGLLCPSDYCFGFFSSWAVTPTLYGERQRAFIPLRKPFTSRQLERLSVRLALFTLGWVLCKARAWSPFPHRAKQLMRGGKKERKRFRGFVSFRSLGAFLVGLVVCS